MRDLKKLIAVITLLSLMLILAPSTGLAFFHDHVKVKALAKLNVKDDEAGNLVTGSGTIRAIGKIKQADIEEIHIDVNLDKYVYTGWDNQDSASKTDFGAKNVSSSVGGNTYAVQTGWRVVVNGYIIANGVRIDAETDTKKWISTINTAPVANAGGPYNALLGDAINFVSNSGDPDPYGYIVSYLWDFGDGSTSTDENPTYTYTSPGTYNVSLIVTDDKGAIGTDITTTTVTEPPSGGGTPGYISPLQDRGFEWWGTTGGLQHQCGASYTVGEDGNGTYYNVEDLYVRYKHDQGSTYIRSYWSGVRPLESQPVEVNAWKSTDSGWLNAGTFNEKTYSNFVYTNLKYTPELYPGSIYVTSCIMYLPLK